MPRDLEGSLDLPNTVHAASVIMFGPLRSPSPQYLTCDAAVYFRDPWFLAAAPSVDQALIDVTDEWLKSLVDKAVLPEARVRPNTISAREYGTRLHVLLANAVRRAKLSAPGATNVEAEQLFKSGMDVRYGEAGSHRTMSC